MNGSRGGRRQVLGALLLAAGMLTLSTSGWAQRRPAPVREPAGMEVRVKRLESQLNSAGLVDILERVDRLQETVRSMRGELEVQANTLSQIKQRQRQLYIDVDRRVQRLESGAPAAAGASPAAPSPPGPPPAGSPARPPRPAVAAGPPAVPAPSPEPSASDSVAEQDRYQKAFNLLKEGRYDQAATAFKGFLGQYPRGKYADNAQYWLGEAFYVTRRFPQSMQAFRKLVEQYPDSPKLSHGLLKIGYIHQELNQLEEAKKVLGEVVTRYPKTAAARLARERLEKIRAGSR